MGLFDIFKSRGNKGNKIRVPVEFTKEETEAINKNLETYRSFAEGREVRFHPKQLEAFKAQGLFEYASQLVDMSKDARFSIDEIAIIFDKAIKAEMKAYGLHDLPLYLFHLAHFYELAGNLDQANTWFKHFLRLQSEFRPDKVDDLNLAFLVNWQGFDVAEAIQIARGKVEKLDRG